MFAGYNCFFKLFFLHFLHVFFASRHFISKVHFFKIQASEWTAYIKSWKFREVCLIVIPIIYIYPEQEYIMNVLKDILFLYGGLYLWPKTSKILQTVVESKILRIVEQPYPLTAKACKNQNLRIHQIQSCRFYLFLIFMNYIEHVYTICIIKRKV